MSKVKMGNSPAITAISCALVGLLVAFVVWNLSSRSGISSEGIKVLEHSSEHSSEHSVDRSGQKTSSRPNLSEKATAEDSELNRSTLTANSTTNSASPANPVTDIEATVSDEVAAPEQATSDPFRIDRIGLDAMSDEDRRRTVIKVRTDAQFRSRLIDEYRANMDNKRAVSMASILYRSNTPDVTALGEELALSGILASQRAGLDLLGRQQNRNLESRQVILDVLSVETNPEVLKSAMSAMAQPGRITPDARQELLTQFNAFAYNEHPDIRGHSYTLMGKWSNNTDVNTELLAGLIDESHTVRSSAIYALMDSRYPSEEIKTGFFSVLENSTETLDNRKVALRGLAKYDLSLEEQSRVQQLTESLE